MGGALERAYSAPARPASIGPAISCRRDSRRGERSSFLSKIIQFNTVPAIAGAAAAGYRLVPVDHDPFAQ
jgi:hypothetical protein